MLGPIPVRHYLLFNYLHPRFTCLKNLNSEPHLVKAEKIISPVPIKFLEKYSYLKNFAFGNFINWRRKRRKQWFLHWEIHANIKLKGVHYERIKFKNCNRKRAVLIYKKNAVVQKLNKGLKDKKYIFKNFLIRVRLPIW